LKKWCKKPGSCGGSWGFVTCIYFGHTRNSSYASPLGTERGWPRRRSGEWVGGRGGAGSVCEHIPVAMPEIFYSLLLTKFRPLPLVRLRFICHRQRATALPHRATLVELITQRTAAEVARFKSHPRALRAKRKKHPLWVLFRFGACDRFRCKAEMRESPVFSRVSAHFLQNCDLLFVS
jgi:hypothetical protein